MGGLTFGGGFFGQYSPGGTYTVGPDNEPDVIIQVRAQRWRVSVPAQPVTVQVPAQRWVVRPRTTS